MTNNNSLKEFVAKQIRHLRLEKGLTQEYLAEKAELGFNYIYRLESKQLNVTVDTIEKIMKALEIDINTFFNVETQQRESEFNKLFNIKVDSKMQDFLVKPIIPPYLNPQGNAK